VSKAFLIPKNTAPVDMLLLKFRVTWSISLIHWSIILWSTHTQKPNWLSFCKFLSFVRFWIILKVSFSYSLPVVYKRLIGWKFGVFAMIFISFQGAVKWPSWKQRWNKCVKYTRGPLGRCRRHSFGMQSKP
jgi:hypothetical protein